ncbi:hypothetical protein F0562_013491 [Nyssa sinensis]|uniref:Uncharacterized protein n=1 Tax=Nyssa sinensis TaxID=561372 RepID=A0A5J4ZKY4_9ASTE|nr:hypothetical protein F0562_013491 [Nyssa sinensis]
MAEGPADALEAIEREEETREKENEIGVDMGLDANEASTSANPIPTEKTIANKGGRKRFENFEIMAAGVVDMARSFREFFKDVKERMGVMANKLGYEHDLAEVGVGDAKGIGMGPTPIEGRSNV